METINTLNDFLTSAGTQYQVFDLGRRVEPIDPIQFAQIEAGMLPYPSPRSGHAWLGLVFWNEQANKQHYVWFLKMPLDERGLLNPSARTEFLNMVVQALGRDPSIKLTDEQQEQLNNNPFTFTPPQEKMAVFNARIRLLLAQPASVYFEPVQQYLAGQHGWDNWQSLGLQGFADFVVRANSLEPEKVSEAILTMPLQPMMALASVSEHQQLDNQVADAWYQRWVDAKESEEKLLCLRALSCNKMQREKAIAQLLEQSEIDEETLLTLVARLWDGLNAENMEKFLVKLAQYPGDVFNALYTDLVAIPGQRPWVLRVLRDPNRCGTLDRALLALTDSLKQK